MSLRTVRAKNGGLVFNPASSGNHRGVDRRVRPEPWIAILLSVMMPGLGHGYCHMWARGLFFFFFATGFTVLGLASAWAHFSGMTFLSTIGAFFYGLCIFDTYRCSVRVRVNIKPRISGPWAVALFFLGLFLFVFAFSVVVTGTVATAFVGHPVSIDSDAMLPTLKPGDKVLANRQVRLASDMSRGDLVALDLDRAPGLTSVLRVAALPGQTVRIEGGQLYVDGEMARDPHVSYRRDPASYPPKDRAVYASEFVVPERSLFLLSDVRDAGRDSRDRGPLLEKEIIGRVDYMFYPPERHRQFADSYLSEMTKKLLKFVVPAR